jgi:hypothetical protein
MESMSPPPFPPPVQPQKKGLPPLAWAGIGCGGIALLVLVGIAIAAMKLGKSVMKSLNEHPAKEAVEAVLKEYPAIKRENENSETGTITLRGFEAIPTDYDQLLHGKVRFSDPMGTTVPAFSGRIDDVPAWVPRYPGATGEISLLHQETPTRIHGILVADTTDRKEAISSFFEAEAGKLSGVSASGSSNTDFNGRRSLNMSFSGGKYRLEIHAYGMPGGPMTVVTVYTEEK